MRNAAIIAGAAGLASLAACGGPSTGGAPSSPVPARPATAAAHAAHHRRHHDQDAVHHQGHHRATAGLLAIHDPGTVTGTLTGPCRTRDHGLLPEHSCTPGAIDPAVTQANIRSTICRAGFTDTVRPPESATEAFKWNVAEPAYGQHDVSGELDHLVPLELGGDNDASNLWVENYRGFLNADDKDRLENYLHDAVCSGRMRLQTAQEAIATDWVKAYCAARLGECPAGLQ